MVASIKLGTGETWLLDEDGGATIRSEFPVILPEAPRLRHSYIMAGTGSGKSELLKLLIHHEMSAGRGVVVIDAHSDLCEQIARWPEFASSGRVAYITPNLDAERTAVLNPFEIPKGLPNAVKDMIAERLGATVGEICSGLGSETLTTRMETAVTTAVRVILEMEHPSFAELRRALSDETPPDIMALGLSHWNPEVRSLFAEEWNTRDYKQAKAGIRSRLRRLLSQYTFRNMTCGRSTVPFYELAESGHTMLFSLGGSGGTTAAALGKLVVCMTTIVAFMRFSVPEQQRKQLHVFMDECQNFVGPSTVTALEELRKFRVFLTMANQSIDRLPDAVQTGILSNVGALVMGDGSTPTAMLKKLRTTLDMAQTLEPRKFLVRWGNQPTFMLYPRSDLAQRQDALTGTDWLMVKARQRRRYYAPIVDELPAEIAAEWQDAEEVNLAFD